MKIIGKLLGLLIIISSLGALLTLFAAPSTFVNSKNKIKKTEKKRKRKKYKENKLQSIWKNDFNLMMSGDISDELKSLYQAKKIKVYMLDKNLHPFFENLRSPLKTRKDGKYLIEVSFMSHLSELKNENQLIIQYNVIENKSGNMVWEVSRNISLPNNFYSLK